MGLLHRFLLLTAFALLSVFAKAAEFDHTKLSRITEGGYGGRLLRTATMSDDEERGQLMPSFIKSRLTNWRINSWIQNNRPDDYVLRKLKLTGLAEKTLTENPNYKIFQKFKVNGWLKERATTTKAWGDLGLTRFSMYDVHKADGFNTYTHYVIALFKKAKKVDSEEWSRLLRERSVTELVTKTMILRGFARDDQRLRSMLGI
ncbi:hypothetical protein PC128_g15282 [Phytophthora cactorum]|nr:hypothetical protein PC128_g15282 [Phytophthora cactorum]